MGYDAPALFVELIDHAAGDEEIPAWNPYAPDTQIQAYLSERLISFTFSEDDRKKDQAIFKLRNDDFTLLDTPAFAKGQKLLLSFGWPGAMSPPRRMVIVGIKGTNPVEITCHCTLELLDLEAQKRRAEGLTDSEFVRQIAEANGYTGSLAQIEQTTVVREVVVQPNITDARMLHRLAVQNGFVFYIDGTGLHWHRRATGGAPVREYIYMSDPGVGAILERPEVEVNARPATTKVRVRARDPITGESVVGEATGSEAGQPALGNEIL